MHDEGDDDVAGSGRLCPQYPGDDTRPTSRKELAGWYSYGWAAEVFTVCAMGMENLLFSETAVSAPSVA